MHERDSDDDRVMMTFNSLMTVPRALHPRIYVVLHGDMVIFVGYLSQLMMWYLLMLIHDLEDDGGWQLTVVLGRHFYIFIGVHYSLDY